MVSRLYTTVMRGDLYDVGEWHGQTRWLRAEWRSMRWANLLVQTRAWTLNTQWTVCFWLITLAFLGRFIIFILFVPMQTWRNRPNLQIIDKIYHFILTVSPHYLVKLKRRINSTFWSQSSQRSIEPVIIIIIIIIISYYY